MIVDPILLAVAVDPRPQNVNNPETLVQLIPHAATMNVINHQERQPVNVVPEELHQQEGHLNAQVLVVK